MGAHWPYNKEDAEYWLNEAAMDGGPCITALAGALVPRLLDEARQYDEMYGDENMKKYGQRGVPVPEGYSAHGAYFIDDGTQHGIVVFRNEGGNKWILPNGAEMSYAQADRIEDIVSGARTKAGYEKFWADKKEFFVSTNATTGAGYFRDFRDSPAMNKYTYKGITGKDPLHDVQSSVSGNFNKVSTQTSSDPNLTTNQGLIAAIVGVIGKLGLATSSGAQTTLSSMSTTVNEVVNALKEQGLVMTSAVNPNAAEHIPALGSIS